MKNVDFKSEPEIQHLLEQKLHIEKQIESILRARTPRFSRKKFVADLGEYYFYINANNLFKDLKQSDRSNSDYDFTGTFEDNEANSFGFQPGILYRIEVKTRYDQKGANQVFGLKPSKFDILAFVSISEDYKCYYIGLIRSTDIKPDAQNRIVFSRLKDLVFWPNNTYHEFL